jgi:hypothetical protein
MPRIGLVLLGDFVQWLTLGMRSHTRLAAENLFLRKQLAFYAERRIKPRRLDDATRLTLVVLARFIEWRRLLTVVQPATPLRWHRQGFRLFWRWRSRRRGRPQIPAHLQALIAEMACANRTWGAERIAAELLLKLGISVAPRIPRDAVSGSRAPGLCLFGLDSETWGRRPCRACGREVPFPDPQRHVRDCQQYSRSDWRASENGVDSNVTR